MTQMNSGPVGMPPTIPPQATPEQRIKGPAIGLIVTAAIGGIVQIIGIIMNLAGFGMAAASSHQDRSEAIANMIGGTFGVIGGVVGIIMAVVILIGAMKMMKLQSWGFAMAVAILAMIPCFSPCCVLGLPFGIWALIVLVDAQVKAAFR